MNISPNHLKEVCKMGQGNARCRYLTVGPKGFECVKNTSLKNILDSRVAKNVMVAQGDNCDGGSK